MTETSGSFPWVFFFIIIPIFNFYVVYKLAFTEPR